ncbi:ATP-binding protein [soil metagenome]
MLLPSSLFERFQHGRLALRLATSAGLGSIIIGLVALWTGVSGLFLVLAVGTGVTVLVYVGAMLAIASRIELARETLRAARKRRFGNLASLPQTLARDELDVLIHQVYRIGRTLQEEIERLEKLESYRREFLGDVTHELKTPIFAVSGFAESLLDGALDDPRVNRTFLRKILKNARRLNLLAHDLTEISRLESGELILSLSSFSIGSLVSEVVESLNVLADARSVNLTTAIEPGLPPAYADLDRIRQVIANLVENAIRYNQPGGTVEVIAHLSDGEIRIAVSDDGVGISAENLPRVTERFFRIDKSRSREQGGTGLGLAIVKHVLERHGQTLLVESQVGLGSCFSFNLPRHPSVQTSGSSM